MARDIISCRHFFLAASVWPLWVKEFWHRNSFLSQGLQVQTLKPADGFEDADSRQFLDALGKDEERG